MNKSTCGMQGFQKLFQVEISARLAVLSFERRVSSLKLPPSEGCMLSANTPIRYVRGTMWKEARPGIPP